MLVDFFIVGAPKAGTTSLFYYLNKNKGICMSSIKEPNFFSSQDLKIQKIYYDSLILDNLKEYERIFTPKNKQQIIGEASVSYLFYPNVANRIFDYNARSKIIIILRDPVERAFSHYSMDLRLGHVKQSLDELFDLGLNNKDNLFFQQYILLGQYYEQVNRYIEVFGRENICVKFYDELKLDASSFYSDILKFLHQENDHNIDFNQPFNKSKLPSNKFIKWLYSWPIIRKISLIFLPLSVIEFINIKFFKENNNIITNDLKSKLHSFFLEDIEKLEKLLSKDLKSWKK
tara:strand:+ start:2705 stop:3568 length:864 start_codon:yes stop_codon:yes gene_type:complete